MKQYHELTTEEPAAYDFSENELVGLGYRLLAMKKIADAIEMFKLSVEAYPQSYNTYDSLAEAYMDHSGPQRQGSGHPELPEVVAAQPV